MNAAEKEAAAEKATNKEIAQKAAREKKAAERQRLVAMTAAERAAECN